MWKDGYQNITNIDISESVIATMIKQQEKHQSKMDCEAPRWLILGLVMDALNMDFESASFDKVIDKGTLDALCCGTDYSMAKELLREMLRVCKIDGTIWLITNTSGSNRIRLFEECFEPG